jgi:Cytosine/adenosine deaminases
MATALAEARAAADVGEVPVGAVVLRGAEVIGLGRNRTREAGDATAHAEMLAIRSASRRLGTWWLEDCTLYATLEPCAMCAGAIVLARIPRLVYGAADPKAGACGSLRNIVQDPRLNHRLDVRRGVLEADCGDLLRRFFEDLRGRA